MLRSEGRKIQGKKTCRRRALEKRGVSPPFQQGKKGGAPLSILFKGTSRGKEKEQKGGEKSIPPKAFL